MKLRLITVVLTIITSAALAQTTPGEQFMQCWGLDGNGAATLEELREMRGTVFLTFDANEEYILFDKARANDVANYQAKPRGQKHGMSLLASDSDSDDRVGRDEFLAGAEGRFADLDRNGDGIIILEDFAL